MGTEKKRREFTDQFRIDAVNLVINGGRKVSDVARELGFEPTLLHRWKRQLIGNRDGAFPGKERLGPQDEELQRLRKELADAKQDSEILKKPWDTSPNTASEVPIC